MAGRYPRLSRVQIEAAVQRARRVGHVLLLDVIVERMGALAVPVFGTDARPVAALSIAALSDRLSSRLDALLPAMRQAADALSAPGTVVSARAAARAVRRDEEETEG